MALVRLVASLGAGGVLYLTPIVFHQEAFSAQAVTRGWRWRPWRARWVGF